MSDNRAGSNNRAVAYRHTGQYCGTSAYPHAIAYSHRLGPFHTGVAFYRVEGMACRIYAYIRTYKHVVAKTYASLIKDRKIEIGEKVFSNADIAAVITTKRTVEMKPFATASQQLPDYLVTSGCIARTDHIEFPQKLACYLQTSQKLGMYSVIYLTVKHLLPFFFKIFIHSV